MIAEPDGERLGCQSVFAIEEEALVDEEGKGHHLAAHGDRGGEPRESELASPPTARQDREPRCDRKRGRHARPPPEPVISSTAIFVHAEPLTAYRLPPTANCELRTANYSVQFS